VSLNDLLQDDARDAKVATLVELLDYRAAQHPHDVVFRFLSGDGVEDGALTYQELRDRACSIAAALGEHAAPGDRVVLLVPPGLEYVASFFGCLYAGVVAVRPIRPTRGAPIRASTGSSRIRRRALHSCTRRSRRGWRAGSR